MKRRAQGGAILSLITLQHIRALVGRPLNRILAASIALVYAFVSMIVGGMLEIFNPPVHIASFWLIIPSGNPWWNYPGLLVVTPAFVLGLPFFPTISMALLSVGVGMGGATGLLLAIPSLRRRFNVPARQVATSAGAGAAPAVTGLATLGACCCTACVGAAGVAVVAAASGTSLGTILQNNWYVGIFELAVVWFALLAQERALRAPPEECAVPPPKDRWFVAGSVLRIGLLLAGITWSLAMLIEWGHTSPLRASAFTWYHWIFEHQLLAATAILAAMFPRGVARTLQRFYSDRKGWALRIPLLVAGITWGTWVPSPLANLGLGGFLNELFGFSGYPAAYAAITPDASLGAALLFHWAFQHLLLSVFAIALAIVPTKTLSSLLWTVTANRPKPVTQDSNAPPAEPRSSLPGIARAEPADSAGLGLEAEERGRRSLRTETGAVGPRLQGTR